MMQSSRYICQFRIKALYLAVCSGLAFASIHLALAGPMDGQVVGDSGSINQVGLNTTINQTSQNMAIDWQSYNVNVDERVQFIQSHPVYNYLADFNEQRQYLYRDLFLNHLDKNEIHNIRSALNHE